MTARLHLICRDAQGVTCLDPKEALYRSEAWALASEEISALDGGRLYLHQTKTEPAYFGGTVIGAEALASIEGEAQRYAVTLKANREAKGVAWDERGRSHGMAWSSGVVQD